MYFGVTQKICELVKNKPGLTAEEIAQQIDAKLPSVKVFLIRLVKKNVLQRQKSPREVKTKRGPQNLYTYSTADVKLENADTQN